MEKGVLTSVQEQKLAQVLDDLVKAKGLLELADGYVFKLLITFLDDKFADKLNVEIKEHLANLADALLVGNWDGAEEVATIIINKLIDIPLLDETSEGLLFKGIVEFIVGAVLKLIGSKKNADIVLVLSR